MPLGEELEKLWNYPFFLINYSFSIVSLMWKGKTGKEC